VAVQNFSYTGGTLVQILPYLLPFLILPEMIALDFLLPSLTVRILSDVLHVAVLAGMFWLWLGAQRRPHCIEGNNVTLHRGCFASFAFAREEVQRAAEMANGSKLPAERSNESSLVWLALPGTPSVEIRFKRPLNVQALFYLTRTAPGIIVAVDDPQGFCRALL